MNYFILSKLLFCVLSAQLRLVAQWFLLFDSKQVDCLDSVYCECWCFGDVTVCKCLWFSVHISAYPSLSISVLRLQCMDSDFYSVEKIPVSLQYQEAPLSESRFCDLCHQVSESGSCVLCLQVMSPEGILRFISWRSSTGPFETALMYSFVSSSAWQSVTLEKCSCIHLLARLVAWLSLHWNLSGPCSQCSRQRCVVRHLQFQKTFQNVSRPKYAAPPNIFRFLSVFSLLYSSVAYTSTCLMSIAFPFRINT